jgi:putative membrane protein
MKTIVTNITRQLSWCAVVALCAFTAGNWNARAEDKGTPGSLSSKDFKFVNEAAESSETEIALGNLAAQKGMDQAVRDFGKRMKEDHQKANGELKELAKKKGAMLAIAPTKKEAKAMDRFAGLSGKEFDKAYIKEMVSEHKNCVKEFEEQAQKADDVDLKAWATKTLPSLKTHQADAQRLEATIVAAAGN